MKTIILYDKNHERVGETYPRRAKQLIKSGRATWLVEDQSLLLEASYQSYPPTKEETKPMTDVNLYTNDGSFAEEPEIHHPEPEASNELLLYIAKKNVTEKRSFIRHLIAYILAWPVLHTIVFRFFHGMSRYSVQAEWGRASIHVVNDVFAGFSAPAHAFTPVAFIQRQNLMWHFALGAMAVWGVWILIRGFKVFRRYLQSRSPRPLKPDPIEKEYQRLMGSR